MSRQSRINLAALLLALPLMIAVVELTSPPGL